VSLIVQYDFEFGTTTEDSQSLSQSYVKYATAAYGDAAIQASNMDLSGEFDWRLGDWTKERVSKHIGIPPEDLILMDVKYTGDATQLRHFIAVDHSHEKVVLAIRGTFCASEVTVDVVGYSREYD